MHRVGWFSVLCLLAFSGCSLITAVDHDKIPSDEVAVGGSGGSTGSTSSSDGGGSPAGGSSTGGSSMGGGGQGGAINVLNCDDVPDGTFVAKFQIEGTKPDGEDYIAADGFQSGDVPGTWSRKYLGTDPNEMLAKINFGLVGPTWSVQLSWGLAKDSDPNKPGMAADFWVCNGDGPDWGCGVDLTHAYLGCYGHSVISPNNPNKTYTIP